MSLSDIRVVVPALLACACACAVAAEGEPAAAPPAPVAKQIALTVTGYPMVGSMVTPGALQAAQKPGFWAGVITRSGATCSAWPLDFNADTGMSQAVNLGGLALTFSFNAGKRQFEVALDKGAAVPLKAAKNGLEPLVLPLANKRKMAVAFPVAASGATGGYVYLRSAATCKGAVDGEALHLLDDDLDGSLTSKDLLGIGASPVFMPIPQRLATRKAVYAIGEIAPDGSRISVTPDATPTAACAMRFTGDSVGHAVIASADGGLLAVAIGSGEALRLPAGTYKIQYGAVYGKDGKAMAVMLPGELPALTIDQAAIDAKDPKQKPVLAWGGPFKLAFQAAMEDGKLSVKPDLRLLGNGGEEYRDFRWQGPPSVYVNGRQNGSMGFG